MSISSITKPAELNKIGHTDSHYCDQIKISMQNGMLNFPVFHQVFMLYNMGGYSLETYLKKRKYASKWRKLLFLCVLGLGPVNQIPNQSLVCGLHTPTSFCSFRKIRSSNFCTCHLL